MSLIEVEPAVAAKADRIVPREAALPAPRPFEFVASPTAGSAGARTIVGTSHGPRQAEMITAEAARAVADADDSGEIVAPLARAQVEGSLLVCSRPTAGQVAARQAADHGRGVVASLEASEVTRISSRSPTGRMKALIFTSAGMSCAEALGAIAHRSVAASARARDRSSSITP